MTTNDLRRLTDEELLRDRNEYNALLEPAYFVDSGKYDTIASAVKLIEGEITRREAEGPPWVVDEE